MKIISKIIAPYQDALPFSEGLAAVKINNGWGFIDNEGKLIIGCKYDKVLSFSNGVAAACSTVRFADGELDPIAAWGFIDRAGTHVIPFMYSSVGSFSKEGLAKATLLPLGYGGQGMLTDEEYEKIISEKGFGSEEHFMAETKKCKWGFIDKNGTKKIDFIYDEAESFNYGYAVVKKENRLGYIDIKGKIDNTIEGNGKFKEASDFIGRHALVKNNDDSWDILNGITNYNWKFKEIEAQPNNPDLFFAMHKNINKDWGLIDSDGVSLLKQKNYVYREVNLFSDGMAAVKINGKWGFVMSNGKFAFETDWKNVLPFSENYSLVGGLTWKFIDKKGTKVNDIIFSLKPKLFDKNDYLLQSLREDYMLFENKSKEVGFFNVKGEQLLPDGFDQAKPFKDGWANVKLNGSWLTIDDGGHLLFEFKTFLPFSNGLVPIEKNGLYGYMDKNKKIVLPPTLDYAGPFHNGSAIIKVGECYYSIDRKFTRKSLSKEYIKFKQLTQGHGIVRIEERNSFKYGVIDSFGNEIFRVWLSGNDKLVGFTNGIGDVDSRNGNYRIDIKGNKFLNDSDFELFQQNRKFGLKDKKGKLLIDPVYEKLDVYEKKGKVWFLLEGKWGLMDINGRVLIDAQYNEMLGYSEDEGVAYVRSGTNYPKIDEANNILEANYIFEEKDNLIYSEGLTWVKKNGRWICLDEKGNPKIKRLIL